MSSTAEKDRARRVTTLVYAINQLRQEGHINPAQQVELKAAAEGFGPSWQQIAETTLDKTNFDRPLFKAQILAALGGQSVDAVKVGASAEDASSDSAGGRSGEKGRDSITRTFSRRKGEHLAPLTAITPVKSVAADERHEDLTRRHKANASHDSNRTASVPDQGKMAKDFRDTLAAMKGKEPRPPGATAPPTVSEEASASATSAHAVSVSTSTTAASR